MYIFINLIVFDLCFRSAVIILDCLFLSLKISFSILSNFFLEIIATPLYDFSFDKSQHDDDLCHQNILIDKTSADLLKGSEVDFVKELIGDSFKINNPQSKSSCGCGVSFSL